jgi:DNA-binding MarR family transcriptional regulator
VVSERPADADLIPAVRALATGARLLERALGDMTLPQFRVLAIVASSPERASRVAERAAVSRPSLSGVLDGLESRDWVRRSDVDGDRRGVHLDLTPAGRQALDAAMTAAAAALGDLLTDEAPARRDAILQALALLAGVFDGRAERRAGSAGARVG